MQRLIPARLAMSYKGVLLTFLFLLISVGLITVLSCDKSSDSKKFSLQLLSESQPAGNYCICWNQKDQGDTYVKSGGYSARIIAGSYDTSIVFMISSSFPHVGRLICCDGYTYPKFDPAKPIPDKYAFAILADSCALADTVSFEYALPVESNVKVNISELGAI